MTLALRAAGVALLLAGCAARPAAGPPADAAPDIIGAVSSRRGATLLVTQDSTRSAGYPGASVRVTSATRVERGTTPASADELRVGTRVEVWFAGPVMESFPVQATAGRVRIIP